MLSAPVVVLSLVKIFGPTVVTNFGPTSQLI